MGRARAYDEIKAINNSMLTHFKRSPMHYLHAWLNKPKSTPAMIFGIAAHSYILEPEEVFRKDILVLEENKRPVPDKDYRTTANAEWKAEQFALAAKNQQEVITLDQFENIKRMKEKLYQHELAMELITQPANKFEQAIEWNWKRTHCKGLMDIWNTDFLADYKTTDNADPDSYLRNFFYYDYHRQAGMYSDGDSKGQISYGSKLKDFFFIVQEKEAPFAVCVYKVRKEVIMKGIEEYRDLVEKFQMCLDHKEWEGYEFKSLTGQMFEIQLPAWMRD